MLSGIPQTACLFLAGAFDSFFNRRIAHGPLAIVMAIIASVSTFIVATGYGTGSLAYDVLMICWIFVAIISATTSVITVIMTTAGEYYTDDIRATGTGFIGTVNVVGRYLGPWLAGMLIDATGVVGNSFGIVGVTMLIAAVIAFTFPRLRKKEA